MNNISSAKGFDGNLLDDKSRLTIFLFPSNILMWGSSSYLLVADWKEKSRNLTCSMDDEENNDFWSIIGLYLKILDISKYRSLCNWLKALWSIYRKGFSINLKVRSLSMHVNWCDFRFERSLLDSDNPVRSGTAVVFCRKQKFGTSFNLLLSILRYLIPVTQLNVILVIWFPVNFKYVKLWKSLKRQLSICCILLYSNESTVSIPL